MVHDLPNLRVGGFSTFFDTDLTYFRLVQDMFLLFSFMALTWNFLDPYQWSSNTLLTISQRLYGVSVRSLILYSLTFTTRLAEYYPFTYLSYDFASCAGFAIIFWLATFVWIYLDSQEQKTALLEQQNRNGISVGNRMERQQLKWLLMRDTGRPIWLHVTVGITAILAYLYNYSHLQLTPRLFMWAWSHYLDAVAMLPQMWTLLKTSKTQYPVPGVVWTGVNLMVLSKVFELIDWMYLFLAAEMLDVLAVVSAAFHVATYGVCKILIVVHNRMCQKRKTAEERTGRTYCEYCSFLRLFSNKTVERPV